MEVEVEGLGVGVSDHEGDEGKGDQKDLAVHVEDSARGAHSL